MVITTGYGAKASRLVAWSRARSSVWPVRIRGEPQQTCSSGMTTRIPFRRSTSIASSAVSGRRIAYMHPTKNATSPRTGP